MLSLRIRVSHTVKTVRKATIFFSIENGRKRQLVRGEIDINELEKIRLNEVAIQGRWPSETVTVNRFYSTYL